MGGGKKGKTGVEDGLAEPKVEAPVVEPAKPAVVEVKRETVAELIGLKTGKALDELEQKLGDKVKLFFLAINLENKTFTGLVPKDMNVMSQKDDYFTPLVANALENANFESVSKILSEKFGKEVNEEAAKNLMTDIYSTELLLGAKRAFYDEYKRYDEFARKYPQDYDIKFNVTVDGYSSFTYSFISKKNFDADYQQFITDIPAPVVDQAKIDAEKVGVGAKVKELEGHWLGKLLKTLGVVNDKNGGYEAIINGKNFVGVFIVGLFGGKHLVGDHYDEMVSHLSAENRALLNVQENKARGSILSIDSNVVAKRKEERVSKMRENISLAKIISEKQLIPKVGIKLDSAYITGGTNFEVLGFDLSQGTDGKIVLPQGANLRVNGEDIKITAVEGKTYTASDGILKISGTIPAGTIISGNVRYFEAKETV